MRITIKFSEITALHKTLQRPVRVTSVFLNDAVKIVENRVSSHISNIFTIEGSPAWAELAALTQSKRILLGFPPAHPILYRTGSLKRALIDQNNSAHVFQVSHVGSAGSGSIRIAIGTTDPRFIEHQEGTKIMPARPIVPNTEGAKREFGQNMDLALITHLAEIIGQEEGNG